MNFDTIMIERIADAYTAYRAAGRTADEAELAVRRTSVLVSEKQFLAGIELAKRRLARSREQAATNNRKAKR